MEEQIKSGKVLIKEAEARGISIGEKRGISIGEKRGISIGEENNLKNNIEKLAKHLRIQNNKLTMEEALEQARIILTEPISDSDIMFKTN